MLTPQEQRMLRSIERKKFISRLWDAVDSETIFIGFMWGSTLALILMVFMVVTKIALFWVFPLCYIIAPFAVQLYIAYKTKQSIVQKALEVLVERAGYSDEFARKQEFVTQARLRLETEQSVPLWYYLPVVVRYKAQEQ